MKIAIDRNYLKAEIDKLLKELIRTKWESFNPSRMTASQAVEFINLCSIAFGKGTQQPQK